MNNKTHILRLYFLLFLGLGTACQTEAVSMAAAYSEGWKTHQDAAGFSIQVPGEWQVQSDPSTGKILLTGGDSRLTIWPTRIPAQLDQRRAAEVQFALLEKTEVEVNFPAPEAVSPTVLRTMNRGEQLQTVSLFSWSAGPAATAATLYVITCPPEIVPEVADIFDRAVKTFTLTPSGDSPARGNSPDFVRWDDPTEGAFSVEVPANWSVQGGVRRPNSLIAQARVEVSSPQQDIFLYLGDAFPVYIEPNQFLGPGQTYYDPMGSANPVQYYQPGTVFVKNSLLPQRVGDFEVVSEKERPDITSRMRRLAISEYHAGEIVYRFNGGQSMGVAVCITERLSAGLGFGSWRVYRMALAEASTESFQTAIEAVTRLAGSLEINPQWLMTEARKAGTNSRIIADMNSAISDSIVQGFKERSRRMDAVMERDARARRGIEEVYDPLTGEHFEVQNGSNFYWVDPGGNRVGTETFTQPGVDFRQLLGNQ